MPRRNRPSTHANHERWLVSYADFITLLFAFFVVMFAASQTDRGKAQQVSDSVLRALGGGKRRATVEQKPADLIPSLQMISEELTQEIESEQIQISMQPRGLVVSFTQAALFPSGEEVISPEAYSGLAKVAAAINKLPNRVRLEGHTDSVPIRTSRFRSNWELSAARSIALLDLFWERYGVARERMSIAGYADTAPVASNQSEDGRARNRRADIVILNEQGVIAEPRP